MENEIQEVQGTDIHVPPEKEHQSEHPNPTPKSTKNPEGNEILAKSAKNNENLTKYKRERQNTSSDENEALNNQPSAKKELKNSSKLVEENKDCKNESLQKSLPNLKKLGKTREKGYVNNEHCEVCLNGGEIILCDGCPLSYHLDCIGLKIDDIPKGKWFCGKCGNQRKLKNVENMNDTLTEVGLFGEEEKKKRAQQKSNENAIFKNFEDKSVFPSDFKNINININNNNTTTLSHNSNININGIPPQLPFMNYPSTFNFPYDMNYMKAFEKDFMGASMSSEKKKNGVTDMSQFSQQNYLNLLMNSNFINQNNNMLMRNFMETIQAKSPFIQKAQNLASQTGNSSATLTKPNPVSESKPNDDPKTITTPFSLNEPKNDLCNEINDVEIRKEELKENNSNSTPSKKSDNQDSNSKAQNNMNNMFMGMQNQSQPNILKNNSNLTHSPRDLMLMQKYLNDSKSDKKPVNTPNPMMPMDPMGFYKSKLLPNTQNFFQKGNPFSQMFAGQPQFSNMQMFMNMFGGQLPMMNQQMMYNLQRNQPNFNPILMNNFKNMIQAHQMQSAAAATNKIPTAPPQNFYAPPQNVPSSKGIRYPVEDKLIYENPENYQLTAEALKKPEPKERLIPSRYLGKILKIWDFVITFRNFLLISAFSPEELFYAIKSSEEGEIRLVNEIHVSLLAVFVDHVNNMESQEFSSNKDLLMLKFCAESKNPRYFLKKCWIEVVKIIFNSKQFKMMVTPALCEIIPKLSNLTPHDYNCQMSIDEKITILDYLINSVYETNKLKDIVKLELEKKYELKREKGALEYEFKNKEMRKKELEKSEKFAKARVKIDALSQQITAVETSLANKQVSKQEGLKQKKEYEIERERYISILREVEDFELTKSKIFNRIDDIKKQINSMHYTTIKKMGNDGCKNEYYFFKQCNSRVYIRKNQENQEGESLWFSYNSFEELSDLLQKLTDKGIKERSLINNIRKVYPKKMKFKKEKSERIKLEDNKDETESSVDSDYEYDSDDLKKLVKEWRNTEGKINYGDKPEKPKRESLEKIFESIFSIEEKFSEYLNQYEKEWDSKENREQLKNYMKVTRDVLDFAQAFLFLVDRFKNPYKTDEMIEEDEIPDNYNYSIFSEDGKVVVNKFDERRIPAGRVKLFSKEFDQLDAEKIFMSYLEKGITNIPQLFFAVFSLEGIILNFFKRRESSNKKYTQLTKEITEKPNKDGKDKDDCAMSESKEAEDEKMESEEEIIPLKRPPSPKPIIEPEIKVVIEKKVEPKPEKKSKKQAQPKAVSRETRKTRPKKTNWKETCYICNDFGDLICCDGCTSVVHLFCACLDKVPDEWYCEKCEKSRRKK